MKRAIARVFRKDGNKRFVWASVSRLHLYHPECAPVGEGVEKFVSTQRSACHVCHGRLDRNPEVMS
jgi:hypothetical protein